MNNDSPWNDVKTGDDSYHDGTVLSEEKLRKEVAHKKLVKERAETDGKIKFWGDVSRILGLVALLGYALGIALQSEIGNGQIWGIAMTAHWIFWSVGVWLLLIFAVVAPIRVATLSFQRKKHVFREYLAAFSGVILIFLPRILMLILSAIIK